MLTAYVRTLAVSIGAPANFIGPMAKQQRMALLTGASLITGIEQYFYHHDFLMVIALILLNIGTLCTIYRRANIAYHFLENK